jgi:hypothetical protein
MMQRSRSLVRVSRSQRTIPTAMRRVFSLATFAPCAALAYGMRAFHTGPPRPSQCDDFTSTMARTATRGNVPYVLDMPYTLPDVTCDVLLSDLKWQDLAAYFGDLVHQQVNPGEAPKFKISTNRRALALLPVRTVVAMQAKPYQWVPFLIDTGAPRTFFTRKTIDALSLNSSDHIEIMSARVNLSVSSHHYDDINVLGTDFLGSCNLHVYYPRGKIELEVLDTNDAKPPVWAQQLGADGQAFKVTPTGNDVDALKKAIKAERANLCARVDAAEITIFPHGSVPVTTSSLDPAASLDSTTTSKSPYWFKLS